MPCRVGVSVSVNDRQLPSRRFRRHCRLLVVGCWLLLFWLAERDATANEKLFMELGSLSFCFGETTSRASVAAATPSGACCSFLCL